MSRLDMLRGRNFARDIELVRGVSEKIDRRLSREKVPQDKIDKLSLEELQDLDKIVGLANFMLCKYEDKKDTRDMLENFASIINDVCGSVGRIDDEIAELLAAAEDSLGRIRDANSRISDKSSLDRWPAAGPGRAGTGANNLTNIATEIHPLEYQQKPLDHSAQVI